MNNGINIHLFCKDFNKITSEYRTAIMGLAMISIMLFHQYFTSVVPFNIFHNFGYWGVDVFLFLSGMGLIKSLNRNPLSTYYKRRIKRIIPSCMVCGTTKYFLFLLLGPSVAALKDGLHLGWWSMISLDLWFIPTILILYAISPLLYCMLKKSPVLTLTVTFITLFLNGLTLRLYIGFEWTSPLGVLSWTIERLPVFTFGMFVSIKEDWFKEKALYSVIFLLLAIGIIILAKTGLPFYGYQACDYCVLTLGMPALIIIIIYFIKLSPIILKKLIVMGGKYSLELYLVHEFIFWSLKIYYINVSSWLLLPIAFTLSCLAAYSCKCIVKKILP